MHAHAHAPRPRVGAAPKPSRSIGRRASPLLPAAAPPRDDAAPSSANPLTEADLTAYLASGCKPKEAWR